VDYTAMNDPSHEQAPMEPHYSEPPRSDPTLGQRLKKLLATIGVGFALLVKFGANLKFVNDLRQSRRLEIA